MTDGAADRSPEPTGRTAGASSGSPGADSPGAVPFVSLDLDHPLVAGARGRGVRVAVVDSGVNPANPHLGPVEGGVAVDEHGEAVEGLTDGLGHGTAVAAAVQEKAPACSLFVVKVFHDRLATTLAGLVAGVDHAVEAGARIVNLSLGTPRPEQGPRLREALDRAVRAGVLVVSPREHRGRRWWPGSLPGSAGVLLDRDCPRHEVRLMSGPSGEPVFRASGYPRPIPGVPPERNLRGISFAAANLSGLLARLLEVRPDAGSVEEVARHLAPGSWGCHGSPGGRAFGRE